MTVWKSFLWAYDLGLRPVARINSLLISSRAMRAPHDRNYKYFWPVDIPVGIGSLVIIFAVATPTESRTEIRTVRRDVGSGFASEKLSDGHNVGPNDGHMETRTQTRITTRTVLPCKQGIT
jgi:hypothetical protein